MGVCMTFEGKRPVIYPADGPAVTGPGNAFIMKSRETGFFVIRLYAPDDIDKRTNPTGSHVLGTYKDENNARHVIDLLEKAVKSNVAVVYVPGENEAGDLVKNEGGKNYPVSHKITRQRIADAIRDNPKKNNTEIAAMTGTNRKTVARQRAAMSRDVQQSPKRKTRRKT